MTLGVAVGGDVVRVPPSTPEPRIDGGAGRSRRLTRRFRQLRIQASAQAGDHVERADPQALVVGHQTAAEDVVGPVAVVARLDRQAVDAKRPVPLENRAHQRPVRRREPRLAGDRRMVSQRQDQVKRAVEVIAPPVTGAGVHGGDALVRDAALLPRPRLGRAADDDAAGRLAVLVDAAGQQLDRLGRGAGCEPQQQLQGPVPVPEIAARRGAVGQTRRQPGKPARLIAPDAGEPRMDAMRDHAPQYRVSLGQAVAGRHMALRLGEDRLHRQREPERRLAAVDPAGDDQVAAARLRGQAAPVQVDVLHRSVPLAPGLGERRPGRGTRRRRHGAHRPAAHRQHRRRLRDEDAAAPPGQAIGRISERSRRGGQAQPRQPARAPQRDVEAAIAVEYALQPRGHERQGAKLRRREQAIGARDQAQEACARTWPSQWSMAGRMFSAS